MKQSKVKMMQLVALLVATVMFASVSGQAVSAASTGKISSYEGAPSSNLKTATSVSNQYKAFWFSFYDYSDYRSSYKSRNKTTFKSYFTKVVKKGKSLGMNRVIVQVRPYGDAVYKSKYFPWSKYISGKQGRSPGYDPLAIMVQVAHSQGIAIEAWVNPYRVTSGSTNYKKLSKNNPARKWNAKKSTRRNVLSYGGSLYYNPSKKAVRDLIVNGAKEIVQNYNVDGIHMDDYFYPSFTSKNYKKSFDAAEYNKSSYKKKKKSIQSYRRAQVDYLVKRIHSEVKKVRSNATFGISPAGNISNLTSKYSYYVDIKKWLKSSQYVDYICPQIYWGFKHPTAKFDKVTRQWLSIRKNKKVKLYIGIAVYRAGHNVGQNKAEKKEWKSDTNVLKKQVQYARNKKVDGFAFFDYQDLHSKASARSVSNLKTVLK
ncbi:MAG: family 10 glycosylhydrolase [Anaerostipes sp.]|nr:family 10 glycosylhydrolase [Anaerostipes sp.]